MEILWSPWRSKYIQGFKDEKPSDIEKVCFFCEATDYPERAKELLVVERRELCFAMLNRYPYNNGHLMVAPFRHIGNLDELTDEELVAMMKLVKSSVKALDTHCKPHGYNIGINMGRVSGAGVPGHIHIHIVPRWNGDTSFISVLSDTKVVSQSIEETQEQLSAIFNNHIGK